MPKKKKDAINHMTRIDKSLNDELEFIKDERLKQGIDKKRKSTRILTKLLIKHNHWGVIKAEMIQLKLEGVEDE